LNDEGGDRKMLLVLTVAPHNYINRESLKRQKDWFKRVPDSD